MYSRRFIVSLASRNNIPVTLINYLDSFLLTDHVDTLDMLVKSYLWLFLLDKKKNEDLFPTIEIVKTLLYKVLESNKDPFLLSEDFNNHINLFKNLKPYLFSKNLDYNSNKDIKTLYDSVFKKKLNHVEKAFLLLCRIRNVTSINFAKEHILNSISPYISEECFNYKDFEFDIFRAIEYKNYKEVLNIIKRIYDLINKKKILITKEEIIIINMFDKAINDLNHEIYTLMKKHNDLLTTIYEPTHPGVCENKNQKVICEEPYKLNNFWK